MANTPQPSAGNCRYASSPSRLPCRGRGIFFKVVQASRLSTPHRFQPSCPAIAFGDGGWKNPSQIFPRSGNFDPICSKVWKNGLHFFQCSEKTDRNFSRHWKQFFQPPENLFHAVPSFIFHSSSFIFLFGFPPKGPPFQALRVRAAPPVFPCSNREKS